MTHNIETTTAISTIVISLFAFVGKDVELTTVIIVTIATIVIHSIFQRSRNRNEHTTYPGTGRPRDRARVIAEEPH
jgi:hypothetical protein